MLLSLQWLNDYIEITDLSTEDIADHLLSLGLEVENIKQNKPIDEKILVGQVVEKKKHPNASKLSVCKVQISSKEHLTIVCGASNVREGLKVACATTGSVLPNGLKIKKSKVRDILSEGMICSEKELLITNNHEGIIELPQDLKIGSTVQNSLKLEDTILDVSITPNRGDCLSYIGIARDLAAKLKRTFKIPKVTLPINNLHTKDHVTIKINPEVACGRFVLLYVEGIKEISSPFWLRKRIEASGIRSINAVVDITNYVLLEQGQPVHAYDVNFIEGKTIQVVQGQKLEKLITLDDQSVELLENDLVICDEQKPIGLAGIMGGKNSEVKKNTTSVLIEVAHFSPSQIRQTSKRTGYHTEASHRFERGTDIANLEYVAKRVGQIIYDVMQANHINTVKVASHVHEYYPKQFVNDKVALRLERVKKILALRFITMEKCTEHLTSLGFTILDQKEERMLFEVPSWRHDVNKEIDLIEEVGRLEGFDEIPYEMPAMKIEPSIEDPFVDFMDNMRTMLASLSLNEVITYPFLARDDFEKLNINENHTFWPSISLDNALSEQMSFLRTTLVPSLMQAMIKNRRRGNKGVRLFEISRGYFDYKKKYSEDLFKSLLRKERHLATGDKYKRPCERVLLGGILDTPFLGKTWISEEKSSTFFDGKMVLEKLFDSFNIKNINWDSSNVDNLPFLHPRASACMLHEGQLVGYLGEVHPRCNLSYNIEQEPVVVFELDLERLFYLSQTESGFESHIQKFPSVSRDLSFLMGDKVSYEDVAVHINSCPEKKYLKDFHLFDIYKGKNISPDHKSMALTFIFQSEEKTLTDIAIDEEVKCLVSWLKEKLGLEQR